MKQAKVEFFALDRTLGARALVLMAVPEVTIPGNESVQAEVLLGIGVDDAAIGRSGAIPAKVRAGRKLRGSFGSRQRTTPLDAQAVRAEAVVPHRQFGRADGDAIDQT